MVPSPEKDNLSALFVQVNLLICKNYTWPGRQSVWAFSVGTVPKTDSSTQGEYGWKDANDTGVFLSAKIRRSQSHAHIT